MSVFHEVEEQRVLSPEMTDTELFQFFAVALHELGFSGNVALRDGHDEYIDPTTGDSRPFFDQQSIGWIVTINGKRHNDPDSDLPIYFPSVYEAVLTGLVLIRKLAQPTLQTALY